MVEFICLSLVVVQVGSMWWKYIGTLKLLANPFYVLDLYFLLYFLCKSVQRLGLSMWLTWMILLKVSFCRKRTPLVDWPVSIVFMHILVEMARFQSGVLLTFEGRSINPSWYLDGLTVCGKPFTQNSCCGYEARLRLCCMFFLTHSYKLWSSSSYFEERPELLFGKYFFMRAFTKW